MLNKHSQGKKIAVIVSVFPATSETWMINNVADLLDRGFDVDVYAFRSGDSKNVSDRYREYDLYKRTKYIGMPKNKIVRSFKVIPKAVKLLVVSPASLLRALNLKKYGKGALSLKLIFWSEKFAGKHYDLIHIFSGKTANKFLEVKDVAGIKSKMIVSLIGYDVSNYVKQYGAQVYDRLKHEADAFIVMSNNMKERVVKLGFDEKKLSVISFFAAGADKYEFKERTLEPDEAVRMVSVGRFVEKKGFDDILKALAMVKERTDKKFVCNIIGGGPLEEKLRKMTDELMLNDIVSYKGYMKIEDILEYYKNMHLYLQPSKTASDGDME